MLEVGQEAPDFSLPALDGTVCSPCAANSPALLVFFETDCPTCGLTLPYLNRLAETLAGTSASVVGISQDADEATRQFVERLPVTFPVLLDRDLSVSRLYDPLAVPTLFLVEAGKVTRTQVAFDRAGLNEMAVALCTAVGVAPLTLAEPFDGAPDTKPGCTSRHLEAPTAGGPAPSAAISARRGMRATRVELDPAADPFDYCFEAGYADNLPVVPPTVERVERLLQTVSLPPEEIIAHIPPNYGMATVEKIAANAVMAGCRPEMMRVLIPLVRAACDERFNLHGVQGTTHFAAPLVIVNGPIRRELGFACGRNVFSNVSRANTSLGRAFQLILTNLGGARPDGVDMSTLGNPGKFSYCIAENEEENPWQPLHVDLGFGADQSALTLFAAEPPRGVSEHTARDGRQVLKAISRALATVWSFRVCAGQEAVVVLGPEHVKTLHGDGFTKTDVREFLFENTGVPVRYFADDGGEGTQWVPIYEETTIDGEPCYRKFQQPEAIRIVVAGGTAGKFSAVIGGWATGPRGSQMVTYPIE